MEYKRLTQWTKNGASLILDNPQNAEEARAQLMETFKLACNKLAELEDKIEQGTLIELPCKVGDTVWRWLYGNVYDEWTVDKINIYVENGRVDYTLCCTSKCGCGMDYFYKDDKDIDWTFNKPKPKQETN